MIGIMPGDYLNVAQVATVLHISERGVQKLIERGLLVAERSGRMLFIHKDELARYRAERRKAGRPRTKRKYTKRKTDS